MSDTELIHEARAVLTEQEIAEVIATLERRVLILKGALAERRARVVTRSNNVIEMRFREVSIRAEWRQ